VYFWFFYLIDLQVVFQRLCEVVSSKS